MAITMRICPDRAGFFEFLSTDNFRDRDRLLSIPGARFDRKLKQFVAPMAWPVCLAARGTFTDQLILEPEVVEWAETVRQTTILPALAKRGLLDAPGDARLRPYQRAGVDYLTTVERAMLLDPMGTGKTIQAIMTMDKLLKDGKDVFPALVVCPNSMKLTWEAELHKWLPEANVGVVTGSIAAKRKVIAAGYDILIVNWEALRTLSRLDGKISRVRLRRCSVCEPTLDKKVHPQSKCEWCPKELNKIDWVTIIADEAHRMKDKDAKQTRALCALRTSATRYRFPMTGTPIADHPTDMWPMLHFINPEDFSSSSKFIDRYCEVWTNYWGVAEIAGLKAATSNEFYAVIDPLFRRMPKDLVLPDLPPKQYSTRLLDMPFKQASAYESLRKKSVAVLDNGGYVAAVGSLVKDTRLEQLASSYLTVEDGSIRLANPSNKVEAVLEILTESPTESVIVFAESRQLIELAAKALDAAKISYGMIVGGQTDGQRAIVMQQFQAGQTRVVLSTIKAGGVGITLTKASIVVFMQLPWSNPELMQAEDRAHRIGSTHDAIQIIDLLSAGTCEEAKQAAVRGTKVANINEVLRDEAFVKLMLGI